MSQPSERFRIGELSKRIGVKVETIRYYEKCGIMPNPARAPNGYRTFREEHLHRLRFIRRSRQLGFSMTDIQGLLELVDGHGLTCAEVRALTLAHANMVRKKVDDLKRLEETLRSVAAECTGKKIPECPIIDALLDPDDPLALGT